MIRKTLRTIAVTASMTTMVAMVTIGMQADAKVAKDEILEVITPIVEETDRFDISIRPKARPPIDVNLIENHPEIQQYQRKLNCEDYKNNDVVALACNIYFEARSQTLEGKYAVALVTANRAEDRRWPSTIGKVVWQRKGRISQFEWTLDGKSDRIRDMTSWTTALSISYDVINNGARDITGGANHYHADHMTPYWAKKLKKTTKIDDHIFYMW